MHDDYTLMWRVKDTLNQIIELIQDSKAPWWGAGWGGIGEEEKQLWVLIKTCGLDS